MSYNQSSIRTMRFNIEKIVVEERIPNVQIEVTSDDMLSATVIRMTRRLAVVEKVFESNRPSYVVAKDREVEFPYILPATWWQQAKQEIRLLKWAVKRGWLKRTRLKKNIGRKTINCDVTHKHYASVVIVLNDQNELPATMRSLDVQYRT